MVAFTVGKPVTTDTPVVEVDAGLAAGSHRFQLVVVDDSGLRSKPDEIVVLVRGRIVLDPPIVVTRPPVVVGPAVDPVINPNVIGTVVNPAIVRDIGPPPAPKPKAPRKRKKP